LFLICSPHAPHFKNSFFQTLPHDALKMLGSHSAFQTVESFAKLDSMRELRTGFPEVVFGQGKEKSHLCGIIKAAVEGNKGIFATRIDKETAAFLEGELGHVGTFKYYDHARIAAIDVPQAQEQVSDKQITIVSAGTADLAVAEEAAVTLELTGHAPKRVYDVGVAGLDRLLQQLPALRESSAIVVAAGMEGALPSVIAGLVECPIVAVPTSVGYGASFQGLVPLLAMLNGCAPGVAVVNIDNGFGAAAMARKIINV